MKSESFGGRPVTADVIPLQMYLISQEQIDRLKDEGHDLWTISQYEEWLTLVPRLKAAMDRLREAFADVRLNGGIGLRQADAIDSYADVDEQNAAIEADEEHANSSWRHITAEELNQYYVAPCFFDARGFVFHLPAFLLAELEGKHNQDFMINILRGPRDDQDWIPLLNDAQREALIEILDTVKHHPDATRRPSQFDAQIARLSVSKGSEG